MVFVVVAMAIAMVMFPGLLVRVRVFMAVVMAVIMRVLVSRPGLVTMALRIDVLRQGMVFGKGLVVPMAMAAAVGAGFRVEGGLDILDLHATQAQQHIAQHRVVLEL